MIGSELAGAKAYWAQRRVALIGDSTLATLYEKALNDLGVETQVYSPKDMTVAGLRQAMKNIPPG